MPPSTSRPASEPDNLLAHTSFVRALARELVFDATLARDVEQETWLAALEQAPRDPMALRGWLASIVRNLARRAWRSSARRRDHEQISGEPARAVPTPAEVLEREDQRRALVERVNQLEEPYRAAIVLRYLEGYEPRAIAARLGVPLETVRTRLKRGLELLRARLDRENRGDRGTWCLLLVRGFGLAPSAGQLAAVLLSASLSGTSGVLVMCLAASVLGVTLFLVSPFAEPGRSEAHGEANREPMVSASAGTSSGVARPPAASRREPAPLAPARAAPAQDARHVDLVSVTGRVRDAAGKPFAGAEVILSRWHWDEHVPREALATGRSNADGEFALSYSKSDPRFLVDVERPEMWRHVLVSAFAPGFGPGWQALDQLPAGEEALLTLVHDAPLRGRLLDLEGQPVPGVKVRVSSIRAFEGESLDRFLADPAAREPRAKVLQLPPGHELVAESGPDGRFVIPGIGRERNVRLDLRGSTITQTWLEAVTRSVPQIVYGEAGYSEGMGSSKKVLNGNDFDWVVRPTRPITGVVRAADTGKPMAGVTVMSQVMSGVPFVTDAVETRTDANGRFHLLGMPKGAENQILVVPNDEQPYFMREVSVPDPAGMAPVEVEVELLRGLWVTGRVTDRVTKKPVNGRIHYFPFLDNVAAQKAFGDGGSLSIPGSFLLQRRYRADAEGRFRVVALPGRAIVGVNSIGSYRQGSGAEEIEGQDENGTYATFGSPIEASRRSPTAMRLIDPAPDATSITCDLEVDPGDMLAVRLTDPAGKPLEHCEVRGSAAQSAYGDALDAGPEVVVTNLGRSERRLLRIHQKERCLGLAAYVSLADEPGGRPVLALEPCTTIVGRLLDEGGAPVGGVEVELQTAIDFDRLPSVVSDAEGGFRIEHVVPGVPFKVVARSDVLLDTMQALTSDADLEWGTTTDLGPVRLKLR